MRVTVELTGIARALAGIKIIPLDLDEFATYRDIVRILAKHFPPLIGLLIDPNCENFLSSNLFAVNGDLAEAVMRLDEHPRDGDHLVLLSVITGG
jgi:hypothetical protein